MRPARWMWHRRAEFTSLTGMAAITIGSAMVWEPLGVIVGGVAALVAAAAMDDGDEERSH